MNKHSAKLLARLLLLPTLLVFLLTFVLVFHLHEFVALIFSLFLLFFFGEDPITVALRGLNVSRRVILTELVSAALWLAIASLTGLLFAWLSPGWVPPGTTNWLGLIAYSILTILLAHAATAKLRRALNRPQPRRDTAAELRR